MIPAYDRTFSRLLTEKPNRGDMVLYRQDVWLSGVVEDAIDVGVLHTLEILPTDKRASEPKTTIYLTDSMFRVPEKVLTGEMASKEVRRNLLHVTPNDETGLVCDVMLSLEAVRQNYIPPSKQ
jgi:hypothetical protein